MLIDEVGHGHKHLCVFTFETGLPDILNKLQKVNGKYISAFNVPKALGFCNAKDFEEIKVKIEKTLELRKLSGDKWLEYDNEE